MLEIRSVCKAYGEREVLRGVDLDVRAGEVCGLLGPNGAGKTTLVSVVSGLLSADGGSATIGGIDALGEHRRVRGLLGVAPQELGIYPTLTARANLEYFGGLHGLRGATLRTRIAETAEQLSLTGVLGQRTATLSGGQKRRLHAACAMLHRPRLLFLDEPTVGADVVTRSGLLAAVTRLAEDGCAVVYATHYLAEIEDMGASVAILEGGRIIERGALDDVIARHGSASVELEFSGEPPALPGWERDGSRIRLATPDPAHTAASAIASLNGESGRLRNVRIVHPSLESAYLSVTGHSAEDLAGIPKEVDRAHA